jgi:prepilin-type N-terminal cleavage/methylation domain-containing protein
MKAAPQSGHRAFTLIELLVVLAVMAIIIAYSLPSHHGSRKSQMIVCLSNLKQVVVAELIWSGDHGDKFSAQVSTNAGGSLEYMLAGQLNLHYQNLTSYLGSPRVLHCMADEGKLRTNFVSLRNQDISYFGSLDAQPAKTNLFFAGDRNLALDGTNARSGMLTLTAGNVPGWTKEMHNRTAKVRRGVVAFPDGHGQIVGNNTLPAALSKFGADTDRLVFP